MAPELAFNIWMISPTADHQRWVVVAAANAAENSGDTNLNPEPRGHSDWWSGYNIFELTHVIWLLGQCIPQFHKYPGRSTKGTASRLRLMSYDWLSAAHPPSLSLFLSFLDSRLYLLKKGGSSGQNRVRVSAQ